MQLPLPPISLCATRKGGEAKRNSTSDFIRLAVPVLSELFEANPQLQPLHCRAARCIPRNPGVVERGVPASHRQSYDNKTEGKNRRSRPAGPVYVAYTKYVFIK